MKMINHNRSHLRKDDDDMLEVMPQKYLPFNNRILNIRTISFALDEPIMEPAYYRLIAEDMQELSEHDTVQVRFASTGGRADGMVTLLEAFRMSEAPVVGIIAGECHSAASILALHCDEIIVTPYSTMMCHNISYGTLGKDSDIVSMVTHTSNWASKLMKETYTGFLSVKEMDELLNGKEFWFDADEIATRLTDRKAHLDKEYKKAMKPAVTAKKKTAVKAKESLSFPVIQSDTD